MMITTTTLEIYPGAGYAVENITHLVNQFVAETGVQEGQLVVFTNTQLDRSSLENTKLASSQTWSAPLNCSLRRTDITSNIYAR
jgi:hypothetical protein